MIYITGDCHGDFKRFNKKNFPEQLEMTKDDFVIIWGDFGGKIQRIRPSIIHLMRGQVYLIDGKKVFSFGGASSQDIRDGILEIDDPLYKEKGIG